MRAISSESHADLWTRIHRAGYYPELVTDVLEVALAGEPVEGQLVHVDTSFADDAVRRHVIVLALTPSRLVLAHVDEEPGDRDAPRAAAITQAVDLSRIHSVTLTHIVSSPERHVPGACPTELTLTIAWGGASRIDIGPGGCGDPECENDHGFQGTAVAEDLAVRVSSEAEGQGAVRDALDFARRLSVATGSRR